VLVHEEQIPQPFSAAPLSVRKVERVGQEFREGPGAAADGDESIQKVGGARIQLGESMPCREVGAQEVIRQRMTSW
jgi:hypothetical protein